MKLRNYLWRENVLRAACITTIVSLGLVLSPFAIAQTDTDGAQGTESTVTPLTEQEVEALLKHPHLQNLDVEAITPERLVAIKAFIEQSDSFFAKLSPQTGTVHMDHVGVTLELGEDFYFLNTGDARKVLEDHWNNLENPKVLGMIFAAGTNQDFYEYAIEIGFEKTGYISDKDAAAIDYDDLLKDIKKGAVQENAAREKLGYAAVTIEGWASPPKYDGDNHRLHWAKLVKFADQDDNTLNYNLRFLGRKGVLQFNFIADESRLAAVNEDIPEVVKIAHFNPGHSYDEFNPDTDKVAAYGVAGLIAGGAVAKKLGLLGVLLLFLKKGWVLIFAALAFLGRFFKRKPRPDV